MNNHCFPRLGQVREFAVSRGVAVVLVGTILSALTSAVARAQINSPLDIPGHVLWLDGDDFNGDGSLDTGVSGTPIVNWVDKSIGQGVNTLGVTNGAPTLQFGIAGPHNAVHFTGGSQDKLDNSTFTVSSDYTVFTVVQADDFAGSGHVLSGLNTDGTDAVLYRTGAGVYRFYSGQTTGNVDSGITTQAGATTYKLFGYQINSTGTDLGLFQNSRIPFEGNGPATLNGIRIGNLDRATPSSIDRPEAFAGNIGDVIIYNRVLTLGEMNSVGQYLNTKYSLAFPPGPTGRMTEIETGEVTGGTPSTLLPTSEPVVSGRINAALPARGGLAFAKDHIGPGSPRDFRPHRANDGFYSDPPEGAPPIQEPWIGGTLSTFIGVKLEEPTTIDRIGFEDQFGSRRNGNLTFEYTLDDLSTVPTHPDLGLDPTAIDGKNWQLLDIVSVQDSVDTRHLYSFAAINAVTGVRVRIDSTAAEFAMSELEVWAIPEPTTGVLALVGTLSIGLRRRRI